MSGVNVWIVCEFSPAVVARGVGTVSCLHAWWSLVASCGGSDVLQSLLSPCASIVPIACTASYCLHCFLLAALLPIGCTASYWLHCQRSKTKPNLKIDVAVLSAHELGATPVDDDSDVEKRLRAKATHLASTIEWKRGVLLGTGSFGQVYRGLNTSTGGPTDGRARCVAVRVW